MARAIVVASRFTIERPALVRIEGALGAAEIRRYALYWDKIVAPIVNGLSSNPELDGSELEVLGEHLEMLAPIVDIPDEELASTGAPPAEAFPGGCVERLELVGCVISDGFAAPDSPLRSADRVGAPCVDTEFPGGKFLGYSPEQMRACQQIAQAKILDALSRMDSSYIYRFAGSGPSLDLAHGNVPSMPGIEVALVGALPDPDPDTPIERILKFRRQRQPELLALHAAMDKLARTVSDSPDAHEGLVRAKEEIDRALLDLHRCLDESAIQKILTTLRVYLDLRAGVPAAIIAASQGVPPELGLLCGYGVNALLHLMRKDLPRPSLLPAAAKDFAYVYDVQKRLA